MADRAASVVAAMGRPGFTLGVGPSHQPVIEGAYGLSYDHPGRHTEEYVRVAHRPAGGEARSTSTATTSRCTPPDRARAPAFPVPVLVSALAPRLLRVAGEQPTARSCGWATRRPSRPTSPPASGRRPSAAGRPEPRIVAGLPVAVHDDVDEAPDRRGPVFAGYGVLPNYRRLLDLGGADGPGDAAIVGDEATVTAGDPGPVRRRRHRRVGRHLPGRRRPLGLPGPHPPLLRELAARP